MSFSKHVVHQDSLMHGYLQLPTWHSKQSIMPAACIWPRQGTGIVAKLAIWHIKFICASRSLQSWICNVY